MSIVRISDSSPSGLATDGSRRTDVDRQVLQVNDSDTVAMKISDSVTVKSSDSTVLKSSDSMVGRILNVLECLMKPSDKGGDVMRVACHEVYSSVWKSARHALLGDDNEIGGIRTTAVRVEYTLIYTYNILFYFGIDFR